MGGISSIANADGGRMLDAASSFVCVVKSDGLPRPPGRGFRDYSMIETHHLMANDFILETCEPMDRFPRDGRVVEVEDDEGRVRLAAWRDDRIIVDGVDHPVTLKHWRPCPAP
ncbi:MAG TPA: hypothetical protein VJS43_13525 [Candidatus Acidoferrales bacterium]|nr:hypothetical protein [Candidatus Acidoferrales bacterium]